MSDKVFGHNNPNHDVFVVEAEEGPDSDDNMNSMIGDAVAKHVSELSVRDRQLWEHFVQVPTGDIFQFQPDHMYIDDDPFGLKVADLDGFIEQFEKKLQDQLRPENFKEIKNPSKMLKPEDYRIPDKLRNALEEAISREEERRAEAESEDVYFNNNGLIPYEDWEQNPGLTKHLDVPSTPKPKPWYAGNSTQQFYDDFEWYQNAENPGHPDSKVIQNCLSILNREIDALTPTFCDWVRDWLDDQKIRDPFTYRCLARLIELIRGYEDKKGAERPEQMAQRCLRAIDEHRMVLYRTRAKRALVRDGAYQLLMHKEKEWDQMVKGGAMVYTLVKGLGKTLFENFRNEMKGYHWAHYRRLRKKFAPRILISCVINKETVRLDLNRCRLGYLERGLGLTRKQAIHVWVNRPYESLEEMHNKGLIRKDIDTGVAKVEELRAGIAKLAEKALATKNPRVLTGYAQRLIDMQRANKESLSSRDWSSIWSFYRMTKSDTLSQIRQGQGDTPNEG